MNWSWQSEPKYGGFRVTSFNTLIGTTQGLQIDTLKSSVGVKLESCICRFWTYMKFCWKLETRIVFWGPKLDNPWIYLNKSHQSFLFSMIPKKNFPFRSLITKKKLPKFREQRQKSQNQILDEIKFELLHRKFL